MEQYFELQQLEKQIAAPPLLGTRGILPTNPEKVQPIQGKEWVCPHCHRILPIEVKTCPECAYLFNSQNNDSQPEPVERTVPPAIADKFSLVEHELPHLELISRLQRERLYWIELLNSLIERKPFCVWFTRLALENGPIRPGGLPGPTRPYDKLRLTGYIKIRPQTKNVKEEIARQIEQLRLSIQGTRQKDWFAIACCDFVDLPFPARPRNESLKLIHTLLRRRTDKFRDQVQTYLKTGTTPTDLIPMKALSPLLDQASEQITKDRDKDALRRISECNNEFERILEQFNEIVRGDFFGTIDVTTATPLETHPRAVRFILTIQLKRTPEFHEEPP
jgi:hypothetical protein